MATLQPPPLREKLKIDITKAGRQSGSLYKDPNSQNGEDIEGVLNLGADQIWARWFTDLWAAVLANSAAFSSVTCGATTQSVADWICALDSDIAAIDIDITDLQNAVIAIDARLNSIVCGAFDHTLEDWICGFSDAFQNVTVIACGTPSTDTMDGTFQSIIDNIFFDIGFGCGSVIDYINDVYGNFVIIDAAIAAIEAELAALPSQFMPIDGSGSGVVPEGQGIYADAGAGFIFGAGFDSAGMAIIDGVAGIVAGFGPAAVVGANATNGVLTVNFGAGPVLRQIGILNVGGIWRLVVVP